MTLGGLIGDTARRLRAAPLNYGHGTGNPRDEAAFLVLRGLGLPFGTDLDASASASQRSRVAALVQRRIRERMPVAYLLHEAWLGGRAFYVDERAIVPRAFISELLPERLRPWLPRQARKALDLCTGSGCLAVLLARALPRVRVDAADVSAAALAVARRNIARHRLGRRVRLVRSDLFSALRGRRYHLIVSNPPYVPAATMRALPHEYRHEPRLALAGGGDGLAFVRRILAGARAHLAPGGLLVCEIGDSRRALERAYPRVPFLWPETSAGAGQVFMLQREWISAGGRARTGAASRARPRLARARR
ncbi:MAG: ribosomal protein L3 N(5)-glutamine methyltransferase [Betaproteobacteria bacterium RIFCSPHIGHO2_12_FULL_69_13]|nr:MAG: ribosomal protein L3 N(5)-glutamine methyltransferase [Betaproteobacteria bacterium RIFCSPHIGHO2_12_FULL_69_13]